MSTKNGMFFLGGLSAIVIAASVGLAMHPVQAEDNFEKCYGISKVGDNDGWGKQINPGKYKSQADFDGMAWKFVKIGTCIERGGQLLPFAGFGAPVERPNTSG